VPSACQALESPAVALRAGLAGSKRNKISFKLCRRGREDKREREEEGTLG